MLVTREDTLKILWKYKDEVEQSYDKSRKAKIAGHTAAVTGSAIAIVGFGLTFVTFGASLALTAAGSALAVSGGLTTAGAEVGYYAVSQTTLKNAQSTCDTDRERMENVQKLGGQLTEQVKLLAERYPSFSEEGVLFILKDAWNGGKLLGRGIYHLVDCGLEI